MLDSICRAAGLRTGLFTSPHLRSITERIKIDGQEISEAAFARLATAVRSSATMLLDSGSIAALPTFFEQVTAISLLAFAEAGVDLAILETGLGGRLDATTVAGAATVGITPIALDHQQYLGDSLSQIAAEKAAIIRPGVNAVVAPQLPEALEVILRRCRQCNVIPLLVDHQQAVSSAHTDGSLRVTIQTGKDRYEGITLGLRGRHQIVNAATAIGLAESLADRGFQVPKQAIITGLENARHAGRLQLLAGHPGLLFDGAHNPAAAVALADYLDEFVTGPVTLIFGAMRDKDLKSILEPLLPRIDQLVFTQPDNPRAAATSELCALISGSFDAEKISTAPSAATALRRALELTPAAGVICVTGSLYLIGEIQAEISDGRELQFAKWHAAH
jgi:dihydrofolate synthase/folylpolyglutamate synthase